jgi:hypothetical protein
LQTSFISINSFTPTTSHLYISFILPYSLTSNTSYFQKRGYITSAIHPQHSQRSLSILNNKQIPR